MKYRSIWQTARNLSLDVVSGALICGAMVAKMLTISMPWVWWIALPLSVWVVYTADHLLDAYKLGKEANTKRHLFHYKNFKIILWIWGIAGLSCITWIFYFSPYHLKLFGLGVGLLVALHLLLVNLVGNRVSLALQKELGVAIIYAVGVYGGPFVIHGEGVSKVEGLLFFQFFLLCLGNLLMFALFEIETDRKDGHSSFVRAIGKAGARRLILLILGIALALSMLTVMNEPSLGELQVVSSQILMIGLHILIMIRPKFFALNERYRILGDAVFLLPIWLLIV